MKDRTLDRFSSLCALTKAELLQLYEELFKTTQPIRIRRELLQRIIAYGMQAREFGPLREDCRRRLRSLCKSLERADDPLLATPTRVKPGTRLIRRWKEQTHVVTVQADGFEYDGSRYESLSEIARTITGTRWSGPLFFGLKHRQAVSSEDRNGC